MVRAAKFAELEADEDSGSFGGFVGGYLQDE